MAERPAAAAAMEDDSGDDTEHHGRVMAPAPAPPAEPERGDEEPRRGVAESVKESSQSIANELSAVGVFPAKFSSFPTSLDSAPALSRPVPSSLFPSSRHFGAKQEPYGAPSWLSNSSFSENLLPPPPSFSASEGIEHRHHGKDVLDEMEKREGKGKERERARVEPGSETSDSDLSGGGEGEKSRHKRRKEKRRRKRKKEEEDGRKSRKERKRIGDDSQIGSLEGHNVDRKAAVKSWADGKSNVTKEYYVDTRGDRDNLAFGSLYRMDVARYFRQHIDGGEREATTRRNATHLDALELDSDVQESKAYRYWAGEAMALETRRDFRRIRIHPLRPSATATNNYQKLETFIPLESKEIKKVDYIL